MDVKTCVVLALCVFGISGVCAGEDSRVSETLDAFHRAAAESDFEAYSAIMTADIVFLGTDASERWQDDEFSEFARPHFAKGDGWVYRSTQRHISIGPDGRIAWFDEMLINDKLGKCRGSGVLIKQEGQWKLAQYNLSVPVPNDLVEGVVADIALFEKTGSVPAASSGVAEDVNSVAEKPDQQSVEESTEETSSSRCRKRFKTNRKANC